MPKSGQSRRKRMAHSKKKAGKGVQTMAVAQQQAMASTQAAANPQAPAPSTAVRTPKQAAAVAPPISVGRELRRIGILTAIILVILVVLVRILS